MAKWSIGCSGFHYKHWRDIFYPADVPVRKWFEFYSERFKTLELNVTFYKFPRLEYLQTWFDISPAGFNFSVKVPKAITHFKQFNNTERMLSDFYGTTGEGLKEKLGCILFQLPPRTKYTEERLHKIINSLDTSFSNVLEFRNETWWNADVYAELSRHNITFCGMSHPDLPDDVIQNSSTVYYRLHGVPEVYKSPYDLKTLRCITDKIEGTKSTKKAFIYFNNDIGASAIQNAMEMEQYVASLKKKRKK
jgi:uncharacterized protein YecE (DUF72 family)